MTEVKTQTHRVFAYGTLRHDIRSIEQLYPWLPQGAFISKGTITGALHKLSERVPGVKLTGVGTVLGDVLEVTEEELRQFDGLEGHPRTYRRTVVPVTLSDNTNTDAWVYEFMHDVGPLVEDGDWMPVYERSLVTHER